MCIHAKFYEDWSRTFGDMTKKVIASTPLPARSHMSTIAPFYENGPNKKNFYKIASFGDKCIKFGRNVCFCINFTFLNSKAKFQAFWLLWEPKSKKP